MKKFIACLGFMLMPFHISGAIEHREFPDYARYFDDRLKDGWTIYNNSNTSHSSRLADYNSLLPKVIENSNILCNECNGFYLSGTNVKDTAVSVILSMAAARNNLYKLDLSYTQVSEGMLKNLVTSLTLMENLSYLWLNGCPVPDKCIEILLETGRNIENLSVRKTPLTKEGLTMLGDLCNKHNKINSLGIGGHKTNGEDLCKLIKAINVKNLSIQLSEDLKNGIIQEALYRPGFQYDNLDVFFPPNTTYQDFFTNNLCFYIKKMDVSLDSQTFQLLSNNTTISVSPYRSPTDRPKFLCPVGTATCKLYMDALSKKGDFISIAKNIKIYTPLKADCVLDKKFSCYYDKHAVTYNQYAYYDIEYKTGESKDNCGRYQYSTSDAELFEYGQSVVCFSRKADGSSISLYGQKYNTISDFFRASGYENVSNVICIPYKDSISFYCSGITLYSKSSTEMTALIKAALEDKTSKSIMNHKFYYTCGAYTMEREGPSYSA